VVHIQKDRNQRYDRFGVLILEELWAVLSNVKFWSTWDPAIVDSSLIEPIKGVHNHARGTLSNPLSSRFRLVDLEINQYFAYGIIGSLDVQETGANVHTFFEMSDNGQSMTVEMGVVITGWAAPFYRSFMSDQYNKRLELALKMLKKRLEQYL
jgi:hypothetical protein